MEHGSATTNCRILENNRVSYRSPNNVDIPEGTSNCAGILPWSGKTVERNLLDQDMASANVMCYLGHQNNRTALFRCGVRRCKESEPSTLFVKETVPPILPARSIHCWLFDGTTCLRLVLRALTRLTHAFGNSCSSLTHRHYISDWPCSQAQTLTGFSLSEIL